MTAKTDASHALTLALEAFRDQAQDANKRIDEAVEKVRQLEKDQAAQLANLKYELSNEVLKQANAPITLATQALIFIISVLVVAGSVLTYFLSNNLQTTFELQMKQQVESWLSLENESSIASRTLDAYRTRALLDSYMIQLARQRAQGGSIVRLDFKKGDQDRLLAIVESMDSQPSDFLDALKLLSVARGNFGFGARNDSVSHRLRALFKNDEFDINRKLSILNIMDRDKGLMPVAADIIKDSGQPEPLRFQAFRMLQDEGLDTSSGTLAYRFALEHLSSSQDPDRTVEVVEYLAKIDPFSQTLQTFLQALDQQPRASRILLRMAATNGWITLLPDTSFPSMAELDRTNAPADRERLRQLIATNLSLVIDDGLSLSVIENSFGRPGLSLHFSHTSGTRQEIDFPLHRLFSDTQLLSALFEIEQPKSLVQLARFFNTVYHEQSITNLRLKVPAAAFDEVQRQALGEQVEVQLKVSPAGIAEYRWTDRNGDVHQQPQLGAFVPVDIKVVFDRDYLIYKALYDELMF